MNDDTHNPYGDAAEMACGALCVAGSTTPVAVLEHLCDTGVEDLRIFTLLSTLPFAPVVKIVHERRKAA